MNLRNRMNRNKVQDYSYRSAARYNKRNDEIFASYEKYIQKEMEWLRRQGVSEDEIQNAYRHTGLGGSGIAKLIQQVALENGDNRELSEILGEAHSISDSRRIKDGVGTNAMNLNGYKVYIKDMDTYTNKISDEELQSLFDFPSSKEFQLKDFLNGVADVAESLGDLIVLKYSRTTNWYFIELDSKSMDATISFTVEKIESSPNFLYDIEEYFNDKSVKVIIDK